MIVTRTPYRVSLFGGGTDYPAYYRERGGAVLGFALDKYCYITVRHLPPFFEHRLRLVYSRTEDVLSVDDLEHPAARAVLREFGVRDGLEIHHDGDLPAWSGMGTSSAFVVGLMSALLALAGAGVGRRQLAERATRLEQRYESVGSQDQVWAALGGFGAVRFSADGAERESLDPGDLLAHLMLLYTGVQRYAEPLAAAVVENIPRRLAHLGRMREQVDEARRALAAGRTEDLGPMLHEAWRLKRQLARGVSTPRVDDIYVNARAAGATGGKLLGAGGGGFVLLFVPPDRREAVRRALGLVEVPLGIDREGVRVVRL